MANMQNQTSLNTKQNLDMINKGQINRFGNDAWKTDSEEQSHLDGQQNFSSGDEEEAEDETTEGGIDEDSTADSGVRTNGNTGVKNQGNRTSDQGSSFVSKPKQK